MSIEMVLPPATLYIHQYLSLLLYSGPNVTVESTSGSSQLAKLVNKLDNNIASVSLISMGLVNPEGSQYEEIKKVNRQGGVYKKVVLKEGKIVGAIILGDRRGVAAIKRLMDREVDVTKYKDHLLEDDFDAEKITRKTPADSSS